MVKITKTKNCKVFAKKVAVSDGSFIDYETGEELDIVSIIGENIGTGMPFDLTAVQKNEEVE